MSSKFSSASRWNASWRDRSAEFCKPPAIVPGVLFERSGKAGSWLISPLAGLFCGEFSAKIQPLRGKCRLGIFTEHSFAGATLAFAAAAAEYLGEKQAEFGEIAGIGFAVVTHLACRLQAGPTPAKRPRRSRVGRALTVCPTTETPNPWLYLGADHRVNGVDDPLFPLHRLAGKWPGIAPAVPGKPGREWLPDQAARVFTGKPM